MKRAVSMDEISDGKLYELNDMVKADCNGCKGCSNCCHGMGESIILDPYDIYLLTTNLGQSFEELLQGKIELNVVEGIILPNLKMGGEHEACAFLNEEGRCSIHAFRPGICRLFPLGRYYENHSFRYFLQVHECPYPNKTKVKVQKWIDTPNPKEKDRFVTDWHYFLEDMEEHVLASDDTKRKEINMYVLKLFYLLPYNPKINFYVQFYKRLADAKLALS